MRSSRTAIIIVLLVAFIASALTGTWSRRVRERITWGPDGRPPQAGQAKLAQMSNTALALLLGGLRGPLVMFLWTSSESSKNERNLEDVDTQIEWIRRLQPEFDTVHIFQMWNKAYNHSVQMASLSNKYTTILDALEYGFNVDRERPNNINILTAIGQIYFDKLGNSAEKVYYRRRVREETAEHQQRKNVARSDPSWKPVEHPIWLDADGNILPQMRDTLSHLVKYEPFPQGLSPFAIAYSYYKRSAFLQNEKRQQHAQMSDLVIDSRPAIALKNWAEEEWERGRRMEIDAFAAEVPYERIDWERTLASLKLTEAPKKPEELPQAIYCYGMAIRLGDDAIAEYERHLQRFMTNAQTYYSHMDHIRAMQALLRGDKAFLEVFTAPESERQALRETAAAAYREAAHLNARIVLKYYVDDDVINQIRPNLLSQFSEEVKRKHQIRDDLDKQTLMARLPDDVLPQVFTAAMAMSQQMKQQLGWDAYEEDRAEYLQYMSRAELRLEVLGVAEPGAMPTASR
jgi:hypothetical protein